MWEEAPDHSISHSYIWDSSNSPHAWKDLLGCHRPGWAMWKHAHWAVFPGRCCSDKNQGAVHLRCAETFLPVKWGQHRIQKRFRGQKNSHSLLKLAADSNTRSKKGTKPVWLRTLHMKMILRKLQTRMETESAFSGFRIISIFIIADSLTQFTCWWLWFPH